MMTNIDLSLVRDGIKEILSPISKLTYLGLFPDGINRLGNNYPSYAIRFTDDSNADDSHTMLLSTNITLQIYLYTKDNKDIVLKQNELEEQIMGYILNSHTLSSPCIMNTVYTSIERGDRSEVPDNYIAGYYPNFNLSIISFNIISHRNF